MARTTAHLPARTAPRTGALVGPVVNDRSLALGQQGPLVWSAPVRGPLVAVCALAAIAVAAISGPRASGSVDGATPGHPLSTAFVGPEFRSPEKQQAFEHARAAGATVVRLGVWWSEVAPGGGRPPAGFDPRDPADPLYRWNATDDEIRTAVGSGLRPIVDVIDAPAWAQSGRKQRPSDGPVRPSPAALADFAAALAERYSGQYADLPRVRYWQVWNEPNLSIYLMPQSEGEKEVSPDWYRAMVNAMAKAIHDVRHDNVVIAGGLAPFGGDSNDPSGGTVPTPERIHPLEFMRQMLCMSKGAKPKPTCKARTEFDVWAHHPYTYGGPTHQAYHPDDVSLGDMGEMRGLLDAAAAAGHIKTRRQVGFWVTEFSWDTNPPDPKGLSLALHARWVSEALYRMWQNGVSLVTWWAIRDEPFPDSMFQSGLYLRGPNGIASDRPKPALRAFRFPFVAFRAGNGRISYWGRTPAGVTKNVVVEQKSGGSWRRVVVPAVDRYGIFSGRIVRARARGPLRAKLADRSDVSLPFSLTVPKDFRFCPWGSRC